MIFLSPLALPAQRVLATHMFTDAYLLSTRPAGDTNGDGIGDFIATRRLLFRWASIGTITEETKGLEYRTAVLLYHDLPGHRLGKLVIEGIPAGTYDAQVFLSNVPQGLYRRPAKREVTVQDGVTTDTTITLDLNPPEKP